MSNGNFLSTITSKIRNKLILAFLVVALVPLLALAWLLHQQSGAALQQQAFAQLDAVRQIKANQVKAYVEQIENQAITFSENRMIVEAMQEFPPALLAAREENEVTADEIKEMEQELFSYYANDFANEYQSKNDKAPPLDAQFSLLDDDSLYLQSLYIKRNPNPLGEKEKLDAANDNSQYSKLHKKLHPVVRNYLNKFGYYDIFLCDLESGDIVYSVFKELDFTTSLRTGPYATTNFGKAFQLAADQGQSTEDVFLVDYEAYTPSYEAAASFISTPIYDGDRKIGVAIFQMPIDKIDGIMAERTGLGETGETYAVGKDFMMRNESRFLEQMELTTSIMNPELMVETEAVQSAFNGETGLKVIDDYRGEPVLSSWSPLKIFEAKSGGEPITWALMSEFDLGEVRKASVLYQLGGILLATTVFLLGVAWLVSRNFTKQADSITDMLSSIGIGDFGARAEIVSNDELGTVAQSLNSMCDNTLSLIQSAEEREQIESSIETLSQELESIANGNLTAEAKVGEDITGVIAQSVNGMVDQLRNIINRVKSATVQVSSSASQIQATTASLSKGSEEQSAQIVDTSTAVKQMASSIQQVASKTEESAEVAKNARKRAGEGASAVAATVDGMNRIRTQVQETSKRIKRLGESSQEIGEIVQLISDIADRTSILALNASIQASMAGDAGQGFAVVAEEVERLADRSNEATKQISTLIKAIQTDTAEAISGMEESTKEVVEGSKLAAEAGQTLSDIDNVSSQLAELIESISLAAKQQARGAEEVSNSMIEISEVTQQTAAGTNQAAVSVSHLAELADELRGSVSQFQLPDDGVQARTSAGAPVGGFGDSISAPVGVS